MKISAHWLRDFVELSPPLERIAERLTMAGLEVKKMTPSPDHKDVIFEIEVTPNRPDWLSHFGVAREIAAVENLSLKSPAIEKAAGRPLPSGWKIHLREAEGCPYYTGVYIEGIPSILPTPEIIRERLESCGMRSINFIVDITNYVLLETGQPLHAFDADLFKSREIQIRRAKAGEPFLAIDGSALKLEPADLVIADSESALALAGVMGGKETEVNARTRNIFLESAFFNPRWVRQTSRRSALSSESSYRFERRVDPAGVDGGRDRALTLIQQYAQPRFISGVLRAGQPPLPARGRIHLTLSEIERRLGLKIKSSQVASFLTRLQLEVKPDSQESFNVAVPSFRPDLQNPVDLIEEIARLYGYENIPETLPVRPLSGVKKNPLFNLEEKARNFFSGQGFYETVSFSLISPIGLDPEADLQNAIRINNPKNQDLNWMRPVLLPSLLSAVQRNRYAGIQAIPLYEIANTYSLDTSRQIREERSLGIAMSGAVRGKNWIDPQRAVTFYDLKGFVCAFLKEIGIEDFAFGPVQKTFFSQSVSQEIEIHSQIRSQIRSQAAGMLGEVKPGLLRTWDLELPVFFAQLSLANLVPWLNVQKKFRELPRFPSVERDFAFLVADSVKSAALEKEIRQMGEGLVSRVELFDLFTGGRVPKGYKNLAFRVTYQSSEKTLVSEEIQKLHSSIAEKIMKKFQAAFQH